MSFERELKRTKLKKQMGNNKIHDVFHSKYDTLEKRLRDGMKNARKNGGK